MPRKSKDVSKKSTSWRSISQKSSRNTSAHSVSSICSFNLRRVFKISAILCPLILVLVAVYCFKTGSLPRFLAAVSPRVENIHLASNGPLQLKHVQQLFDPCYQESIMHLDLRDLKAQLESIPQVQSATIRRAFPKTLEVELVEHHPILRAIIASGNPEKPQGVFISDTGYVFKPYAYSAAFAKKLPYLSGVQLSKNKDDSFRPVTQVRAINQFIEAAQEHYPTLANNLHAISAKYLFYPVSDFGSFFTLKTKNNIDIIVNVGDYAKQLERLRVIMTRSPRERLAAIERIDLSQPNQATIQHSTRRKNVS